MKSKVIAGLVAVPILASGVQVSAATIMKKTVTISVDGQETQIDTLKGTVREALEEQGINISDKDDVQPGLDTQTTPDMVITIKKAVSINVVCGDKHIQIKSSKDTVKEALEDEAENLKAQGIEFVEGTDEISPSLTSEISKNSTIQIVKVVRKEEQELETIEYDTEVENDDSLAAGEEVVETEGEDGQKEVSYTVVYKNGVEAERKVSSSKTVKEPTTKVVKKGTGQAVTSRGSAGAAIAGKPSGGIKTLTCEITAYTGGGITASGIPVSRVPGGISTVAVDPSVIPLGSKLYIDGYGYAIAADTGGAIKGNIIDIYLDSESECLTWGRQNRQVTIVAYPGEW